MPERVDEVDLSKLTKLQQKRLMNFYNVDSIDDLEVLDDGSIVVKKKKSGSGKPLKIYLEDYEGNLNEMSIDEFISKQKDPSLGFSDIPEDEAKDILEQFIYEILDRNKKKDMRQLCIEHIGKSAPNMLLFQQFVIFYSEKLRRVLCGSEINKKYIKAVGNPAYSDVDYYNIIKKSPNELIIKGFAFCGYPNKDELFINLVCGTGGTAKLIEAVLGTIEVGSLSNKPKYIGLDSIETEQALEFYHKLGFRKPKEDATKTINDMIKSKAKTFKEYADANPSKAGGKLYLFPHNAQGEKYLKKLKCEWLYNPVGWFDKIKQLKKEKKPIKYIKSHLVETTKTSKLEGDGIGDFFKGIYNKGKELVSNVVNRFKPKLDDFTNQSKATLAKYGDWRIVDMYIQRKPIMGILDKFFNVLTFGKFEDLKKKYGYDKLFHLQLRVVVAKDGQNKNITIEKNETVDITEAEIPTGTQALRVAMPMNRAVSLNQLVDGTRRRVGDYNFFSYDPFNNNCQFFIRYLLETLGMYGEQQKNFLFQDMAEFQKELPKWLPGFSRGITDLGATVANLRGKGHEGMEVQAVVFNKKHYTLDQAKEKAKEIIEGKKGFFRETSQSYRFRNIPKQRFQKGEFKSKKIDKGLTLVLGKLKST